MVRKRKYKFFIITFIVISIILIFIKIKDYKEEQITYMHPISIIDSREESPKVNTSSKYPDIRDKNAYYYNAVNWATSKDIVSGYKDGTFKGKFRPTDNITREQLAVILRNYAKYKEKDVSSSVNINKFNDGKYVSSFAKTGVQWAVQNKIISGKDNGTKIDPKGNTTRGEAATMIYNYCTNIK